MAFLRRKKKAVTTVALIALLIGVLSVFNGVLSGVRFNAAAFDTPKKQTLDIPNDLNFVEDDKKAFLSYCASLYGSDKPYQVDSLSYCYYGTVEGRRIYRFNATFIPYENLYNEATIGGCVFVSPVLYRPYSLGLYVVDGKQVYTLQEAYDKHLVNIRKVSELYKAHAAA